jgi:hypothetical protein
MYYNVTLRRVRATIVAVECVCRLKYPAYNVHAPYCHLWSRLYNMFQNYIINGRFSKRKKLLNIKCVLNFLYDFCLEQFLL